MSTSTSPLLRRSLFAGAAIAIALGAMVALGGGKPSPEAKDPAHAAVPTGPEAFTAPPVQVANPRARLAGAYTFDGRDLLLMLNLHEDGTFDIRSILRRAGEQRKGSGRWSFVSAKRPTLLLRYDMRQGELVDPEANQDRLRYTPDAIFMVADAKGTEIRLARQERLRLH